MMQSDPTPSATVQRLRVLLVDDEESLTRIMKANLERTGKYEVRCENWSPDAAQAARDFKPHVVFLDIFMPGMVGGDVVAQFKADPELKHIPIVFLSAVLKPKVVKEHNGMIGGFPFILKPARIEEICAAIDKYAKRPGES